MESDSVKLDILKACWNVSVEIREVHGGLFSYLWSPTKPYTQGQADKHHSNGTCQIAGCVQHLMGSIQRCYLQLYISYHIKVFLNGLLGDSNTTQQPAMSSLLMMSSLILMV
ncbi:hypothetical protein EMCRGX_G023566 [Ephydatia muelleri]